MLSSKGMKAETLERANEFHDTLSVCLRLGRHVWIRQSQLTIKWEGTLIVHTAEACRSLERCRQDFAELPCEGRCARASRIGVNELLPTELVARATIGETILEDFVHIVLEACWHVEPEDGMVEDDDVRLCQALLLKGDINRSAVGVDLFEITNLKVRLCLEDVKDNLPCVAGVVIRVRIDNEDFHWGKYLDALRRQRIEIIRGGGL